MEEFLKAGLVVPLGTLLMVGGLLCLFVAVSGAIRAQVALDKRSRIAAGVLGATLLGVGLGIHFLPQAQPRAPQGEPAPTTQLPPAGNTSGAQRGETSRAATVMGDFEYGTTRAGGDYRGFTAQHPSDCRDACASDSQCVAFTFVNAGLPGPGATCWLKQTVPAPTASACCVSGVKQSAMAQVIDQGPEASQRAQPQPLTDLPQLQPHLDTAPTAPSPTMTTASLTFPQDGARVGLSVFATGQISGLTPGQYAFLCVKSQAFGRLIYPQGQLSPDAAGTFMLKSIYASAGYSYETFVVSTDDAEAAALLSEQRYRQYGMRTLPPNTRIISPIVVVTRE